MHEISRRDRSLLQWPKQPIIYEINTWVWLNELSQREGKFLTLDTISDQEWDAISALGVDAVWLMGVWERSPAGIRVAIGNADLQTEFHRALPDLKPEDIVGSPYCVRRYIVDQHLGGKEGLAIARQKLAQRGLRLILDYVPNHVAPDHPWVLEHPQYFITGNLGDLQQAPHNYYQVNGKIIALGKDPYCAPWPDVVQLNAFNQELHEAVIETLKEIASQCDGIRVDMAMLFINRIFQHTWGEKAGTYPPQEFWQEIITAVREKYSQLLLIAEVYWDMEWELQQLGFDFCYNKILYDRVTEESPESVRLHLLADISYQEKLVRFIENHDEPRAASIFSDQKHQAAAVTLATLPGAKLFHEGEFEGRKIKLPVFLGRRPLEEINTNLQKFYHKLLKIINRPGIRNGQWKLCDRAGWYDNSNYINLVAWCLWYQPLTSTWETGGDSRYLIVVNLSNCASQGLVWIPWNELAGYQWQLTDLFNQVVYNRDGNDICQKGLYVDLKPWNFHFFEVQKISDSHSQ
ncbi:MAG: alpha-amylase family glycosyl hydrolase [Microcoleaceae cyanobacterium]